MNREPAPASTEILRASALLGRRVRTADGRDLGRVADIETDLGPDGRPRVTALVVTARPWGRLLGYERDEVVGPWILEHLARRILRRNTQRVPWATAVIEEAGAG
jgi:sporulation protein YlmC with PRC-barrel domain